MYYIVFLQCNGILNVSDNMTYAELQPLLAELQTNLTNAESAILLAQDIASDMRYIQRGFDSVCSISCYRISWLGIACAYGFIPIWIPKGPFNCYV